MFVLWFLCVKKLGVITVFKPIQIASVKKLKRKGTVKVKSAVVEMIQFLAIVVVTVLFGQML